MCEIYGIKISKLFFSEKNARYPDKILEVEWLRLTSPQVSHLVKHVEKAQIRIFQSSLARNYQLTKKHQLDHFQGTSPSHPPWAKENQIIEKKCHMMPYMIVPRRGNLTIWSLEENSDKTWHVLPFAGENVNRGKLRWIKTVSTSEGPRWLWRDLRACSNPLLPTPAKVNYWENNPILTEFGCQIENV